jgi:uncharacterized protein involved in exopolysaccharide biosynthesis
MSGLTWLLLHPMSNETLPIIPASGLTLREFILQMQEYWREIWRYWWLPALLSVTFGAISLYIAWKTPPNYNASLTFMLNEQPSSVGISSIASQFLGGGSLDGNLDKITQLARTRKILQTAIFEKAKIDGVDDYFANHLIRALELQKSWAKDTTGLKGFSFKHNRIEQFSRAENAATITICNYLNGTETKGILASGFDRDSKIMNLSLATGNETLTIEFLKTVYAVLSNYYIEKSIARESNTYRVMKGKTDSLRRLIEGRENDAATLETRQRGLVAEIDRVPSARAKRDVTLYSAVYGESVKNLELAKFALENKLPFIQVIDEPIAPIKPIKKSKTIALISGFFIGLVVASFFIIARRVVRNALASAA